MRRCSRMIGAALALMPGLAAPGPPPAAEAFGMLPNVEEVAISPDGRTLAWFEGSGARRLALALDIESGKTLGKWRPDPGTKLRTLSWSDPDTLLLTASAAQKWDATRTRRSGTDVSRSLEVFRTAAIHVRTGKFSRLLANAGVAGGWVTGATMVAVHTSKPDTVIMASWDYLPVAYRQETGSHLAGHRDDSGWVRALFEVNTNSGVGRRIADGGAYTDAWLVDPDGHPVVRSEWDPTRRSFSIFTQQNGTWRRIYAREDGQQLDLTALDERHTAALALGPALDETSRRLWSVPLDGTPATSLFGSALEDAGVPILDPYSGALLGVWAQGDDARIRWLDPAAEKDFASLGRAFPSGRVSLLGRSQDRERMVAGVSGPSNPGVYYLVDRARHSAEIIGEEYPGLAGAALGEVRFMHYKARDGVEIPAFLTLPPGVPAKNLPLVVLVHGGPEYHDTNEFEWWRSFLATRGYAVLQPQFRGSTGFGESFRRAGEQQWGWRMQDDVSDGVRALTSDGTADAKRVCIVGGSYGGYAALAGAAFTPELYACAVSVNGVSDLSLFLTDTTLHAGTESDSVDYWRKHIGSPLDERFSGRSPARWAALVRAPVLLLHAANDAVVPVAQSEAMERALREAGKPVTFLALPGEDHWLSTDEMRVRALKEIEAFLHDHL